ncbi:hypothetical protein [Terasakiella sp. SH-1]|uniref:hypothetical protein n=1 Tax=Terasakiella sp. SH-1 TaxID=2560057 RepID=UPI00107333E1|nr:hypothetical protein [Terasakiella sp. SH-1]
MLSEQGSSQDCGYFHNFYHSFSDLHELYTDYFIAQTYGDNEVVQLLELQKLAEKAYEHCKNKAEVTRQFDGFASLCKNLSSLQVTILEQLKNFDQVIGVHNKKRAEEYLKHVVQDILIPDEENCIDCKYCGL